MSPDPNGVAAESAKASTIQRRWYQSACAWCDDIDIGEIEFLSASDTCRTGTTSTCLGHMLLAPL